MAGQDAKDFERLLAAYGNGELGDDGRARLEGLCAGDTGRRRAVAEIDALHRDFAAERALLAEMARPLDPREEADPSLARLQAAAARAEGDLRGKLARPAPMLRVRQTPSRWLLAAAAVVVAAVVGLAWLPRAPRPETLHGAGGILLEPGVSDSSPEISWHPVPGARSYDVVITDADNETVLERAKAQSRSHRWELTRADRRRLLEIEAERGPLYLRVVARDGAGIELATSGDRVLKLR